MSENPGPVGAVVPELRASGCVFAEDEATLLVEAATSAHELGQLVARRVAGEPLEYILGWAEFCGLRIAVEAGVFVPRRRTGFLVAQAGALAPARAVVVDLCCGSGAVGLALAAAVPTLELYSVDIDPVAVRCARRNIGPRGRVFEGDLFDPLPASLRGRVDIVVANAPYVPTDAVAMMPREARDFESRLSADGGVDGLDVQRRIAADASVLLKPGGHLLVETSAEQAAMTVEAFEHGGFAAHAVHSDELEATVVIGRAHN